MQNQPPTNSRRRTDLQQNQYQEPSENHSDESDDSSYHPSQLIQNAGRDGMYPSGAGGSSDDSEMSELIIMQQQSQMGSQQVLTNRKYVGQVRILDRVIEEKSKQLEDIFNWFSCPTSFLFKVKSMPIYRNILETKLSQFQSHQHPRHALSELISKADEMYKETCNQTDQLLDTLNELSEQLLHEETGLLQIAHLDEEEREDAIAIYQFNSDREKYLWAQGRPKVRMIKRPRYHNSQRSELDYWQIEKELSYRYFNNHKRMVAIKNFEPYRQSVRVCGDINRFDVLDPLDKNAYNELNMVPLSEMQQIENYDFRMANNAIKQMLAREDEFNGYQHVFKDTEELEDGECSQIESAMIAILLRQQLQKKRVYVYGGLVQNPKAHIHPKKEKEWEERADQLKQAIDSVLDKMNLNYVSE